MDFGKLKAPFAPDHIEWRLQQAGKGQNGVWAKAIAYVTARAIMDRLDEVCGPDRWRDEYKPGPTGSGLMSGISILVENETGLEWVTKWDGADNTDVEAVKGGFSGAFKRAAVKWGIGRYLYDLPEGWAKVHEGGANFGKTKDGTAFRWDAPDLPSWAVPQGNGAPPVTTATPRKAAPPARKAEPPRQASSALADPPADVPTVCPKCKSSGMWDNRTSKRNPRQPDFKCKDRECDHPIWLKPKVVEEAPPELEHEWESEEVPF